jgi:uncharacterized SAM-binding protein YcdF (DUF218 family)
VIAGIRLFGGLLYHYPANPELASIPQDAAIVCLAGGKFRVEAAYSLFARGVGSELLIIGAGKRSTVAGLIRAHAAEMSGKISPERFQKIQVENESRNTIENAFALGRYLQQNPGVKTIVLVTSSYHMRRAQVMIENHVDKDIRIIPYTPENDAIGPENWWKSWIGIEVTTVEYFKFLLASILAPQLRNL